MTPHVRARLSAYLDGELPVAERGAVDQHLRACAACARRLEDLAALDAAARALPLAAPPGYFERLPARVRARLDPRPRHAWRPPAWAWAAAAALLLAIVTPATLMRRDAPSRTAGSGSDGKERVPEAMPPQAASGENKLEASKRAGDVAVAPPVAPLQERDAAPRAAGPAGGADRPEPAPGSAEGRLQKQEPAPRAPEPAEAEAPVAGFARPAPPLAGAEAAPAKDDAGRQAAADEHRERPKAIAPGTRRRDVMVPAPALSAVRASSAEACSAGLLARGTAVSLPQARALREGWRACLREFPAAPGADAVRVRLIQAGADVYRRSGDAADLEQVRADAAEYLARADAGEPERVRALLLELGGEP
jgi:hypothetical protein